jgi:hypothetical protein
MLHLPRSIKSASENSRLPRKIVANLTESDSSLFQTNTAAVMNPGVSPNSKHNDSSMSTDSLNQTLSGRLLTAWNRWQRRLPLLKKFQHLFLMIPPRFRYLCICLWFLWKILLALFFLHLFSRSNSEQGATAMVASNFIPRARILYIVTTLSEYNTGTRKTIKGQDRLGEVLIPVLVDGVESMTSPPFNYAVDVFLICAYELKPEREQLIRDSLPNGVGLQVWDDAAPLGYDSRNSPKEVISNTRALARQHRYVIKDKFKYYDFFVAFEDDLRITGDHVEHYMDMSAEIDRLREQAPEKLEDVPENLEDHTKMKFFGQMTKGQLSRIVPGFVRVEVLLNDTAHKGQENVLPVPLDYEFDGVGTQHIDPKICCHVNMKPNVRTPEKPPIDDVIIWETNAKAFSLRELPPGGSGMFDWTVVMLGPGKREKIEERISGYWSGRQGMFGSEKKPSGGPPDLIAQQGGWMATRDQIARMDSGLCMGSFLPPYDAPSYYDDGQQSMNVEFWSGSYQFFTGVKSGCNMQRLISFRPDHFSKHLLYHVANNKQKQLSKSRMVRADHMFGQLNSILKMAKLEKAKILKEKGKH